MKQLAPETIVTVRAALDEVCRHIPVRSSSARTFIATRILQSAHAGETTRDGLLLAGRRAVRDQFASTGAAVRSFSDRAS